MKKKNLDIVQCLRKTHPCRWLVFARTDDVLCLWLQGATLLAIGFVVLDWIVSFLPQADLLRDVSMWEVCVC